jgi:hypothetical protein
MKELELTFKGDLVIDEETLNQAGLTHRVRLLVQKGEIRILPEAAPSIEELVDELAGALGEENADQYDFGLKLGGWHEAR